MSWDGEEKEKFIDWASRENNWNERKYHLDITLYGDSIEKLQSYYASRQTGCVCNALCMQYKEKLGP